MSKTIISVCLEKSNRKRSPLHINKNQFYSPMKEMKEYTKQIQKEKGKINYKQYI